MDTSVIVDIFEEYTFMFLIVSNTSWNADIHVNVTYTQHTYLHICIKAEQ